MQQHNDELEIEEALTPSIHRSNSSLLTSSSNNNTPIPNKAKKDGNHTITLKSRQVSFSAKLNLPWNEGNIYKQAVVLGEFGGDTQHVRIHPLIIIIVAISNYAVMIL